MKEHDMTHITMAERPADWETWLAEAGIDYVEVLACPDGACEVCRAEPAGAAAPAVAAAA